MNPTDGSYLCTAQYWKIMSDDFKEDALIYHQKNRPGKIEVVPTKPTHSQRDLSLAYSPGVAEPCRAIEEDSDNVYKYTAKGNLVAVISNGSAVLGLGDIGPEASKPVMEGKGLLFKIFADIDVFDIELNAKGVDEFVHAVKAMEPTFGGVNLEDIKAPESFEIEERLKKELRIPVMHDDQHGTAIISGAALLNALKLVEKKIDEVSMVINGAGASAIACGKLIESLGVKRDNIIMLDSKGVIRKDRDGLDKCKGYFARDTQLSTLEEALKGADVFVGLSKGNIVTPEMIKSMAKDPIVFAMANPDPEIAYELAVSTRDDIIMATGRSDHPNQVNNVLGFPFIFRGALDVRSTAINEEMKLAAVKAIADLAHEPVPEEVMSAYNTTHLQFGRDYIIPKPIDPRLIAAVAPAVAKAAMESGVARKEITDWDEYKRTLLGRLGLDNKFIRRITVQARQNPQRVVFAEADNYKVLKAAQVVIEEGSAIPILLGDREKIKRICSEHLLDLNGVTIIDPHNKETEAKRKEYAQLYFKERMRKGVTEYDAEKLMRGRNYYGTMMVRNGEADAFISGLTKNYRSVVLPALQIIPKMENYSKVAGMYVVMSKRGPLFFADTTINIEPNTEDLIQIARLTHETVRKMNVTPKMAMLSFSNFGSNRGEISRSMQDAISYLHYHHPEIIIDGEMQANFALDPELRMENFPFSKLGADQVNTFIFPNLASGNIAYKMAQKIGDIHTIGPVLMGFSKSIHVLQLGSTVREIVNMVHIAVADAQNKKQLFS